jgi:cyanate lyase
LEKNVAALKNRAEVAERVIDSMVGEGLSLRKASLMHGVSAQTVLRALDGDRALAEQYDRARAAVIERLADEVMELADAPVAKLDNGATDPGLVRQRQLQVDTRKWFLSKLAPKVYGDRLDVSVSDTRISITGALAAAQSRLIDVIDVVPRISAGDASDSADEGEG